MKQIATKVISLSLAFMLTIASLTNVFAETSTETNQPEATPVFNSTISSTNGALICSDTGGTLNIDSALAYIYADTHTNGSFSFTGSQLIQKGECSSVNGITSSASYSKIDAENPNGTEVILPDYSKEIEEYIANTCTVVDDGSNVTVANIKDNVKYNDALNITTPILTASEYIIAENDINISASSVQTAVDKPLIIYSKNGDINITSSSLNINGIIYAPNGTVTINGSSFTLNGKILAKSIAFKTVSVTVKNNQDYFKRYISFEPMLELVSADNKNLNFKLSNQQESLSFHLQNNFMETSFSEVKPFAGETTVTTETPELFGIYKYVAVANKDDSDVVSSNIIAIAITSTGVTVIGEDTDGDYLDDESESKMGTDKYKSDTDGDGLLDGLEVYIYNSSPKKVDTDGDGLTDPQEVIYTYTDPTKVDTDNNGVPDPNEDPDKDGLTNIDEFKYSGNPSSKDTDFDGLNDSEEVKLGTKLDSLDSDADKLADATELEVKTDPTNPDTNGNGVLDGDESYNITRTAKEYDVDSRAIPTVNLSVKGSQIDSIQISKVDEDDDFLSSEIPGFIGCGYDFSVNGEFEKATLSFQFNADLLSDSNFVPRIYYNNEEEQVLEELPDQTLTDNKVTVELSHFSKYILINKSDFDQSMNELLVDDGQGELSDVPTDVAFVLDHSGSMSWNDPQGFRFEGSELIVDSLADEDSVAVFGFTSNPITPFTTDKARIKQALPVAITGSSSVTYGIIPATELFSKIDTASHRIMVILTDNDQNTFSGYDAMRDNLIKEGIKVYSVCLGYTSNVMIEKLAKETGGAYYHAINGDELLEKFKSINNEISLISDADNDGLTDYHEHNLRRGNGVKIKTNMHNSDTDGDGILDGDEVSVRFRPDKSLWYVTLKSHPNMADSDFDGYEDKADENPLKWDVSDRDLAICSQVAYSYDLTPGLRLDKMPLDALARTDAGFYGTGSASELEGWKVVNYYRETDNQAEDELYGGFSYTLFEKNSQYILAFRGSKGEMDKSLAEKRGDWFNNFFSYPQNNDLDTYRTTKLIENMMSTLKKYSNNIYITGHSRGGYLAQNAMSSAVSLGYQDIIEKLVYFNGMGVVCDDNSTSASVALETLRLAKDKVKTLKISGDVVSGLGKHVSTHVEYELSPVAEENVKWKPLKVREHAMCNFTYHLMPERWNG